MASDMVSGDLESHLRDGRTLNQESKGHDVQHIFPLVKDSVRVDAHIGIQGTDYQLAFLFSSSSVRTSKQLESRLKVSQSRR